MTQPLSINDRVTLKPVPHEIGKPWFPPTSGGGNYVVTAIDYRGQFCVDGLETWLDADRIASRCAPPK